MAVLIVLGLGLLFYGISQQVTRPATPSGLTKQLRIPPDATLLSSTPLPDGRLMLTFRGEAGDAYIIVLAADWESISSRLHISPATGDFRLDSLGD